MPQLVIFTGPIAAGKNTVADRLTDLFTRRGRTVVVVDVDEVAEMVGPPGAYAAGLWPAAHEAHGALTAAWMRSKVDYVVVVGPFFTIEEQEALTTGLPAGAEPLWVVIEAPVSVTLRRAQADPTRGISRDPEVHHRLHHRFKKFRPNIPAHHVFDSSILEPNQIASKVATALDADAGPIMH